MKQLLNRLSEIEIDPKSPFDNDALGRQKYAEILTTVVNSYSETGCVLAINGKWGTGKTTFINMWRALLVQSAYKTLYFNAWESDYMDDPLVALVSEVRGLNADDGKFKNVAANVGKIVLSAVSSTVVSVLKNKFGVDCDAINDTLKAANDVGEKCLDDYAEQKKTFKEFKGSLQSFIADNAGEKPVVFFIDELDRCRPDYSVKVLERIKHLFDLPNIIFVLSVNKKQLGHAIQGFYGTSSLDADDYLRRFIDLEYDLPKPNMEEFIKYLYNQHGFDDFLNNDERRQYFGREDEPGEFRATATQFAELCHLDLRTLDRIFTISRITLQEMNSNNYLLPDVLFVLCLMKIKYPDIYRGIVNKSYKVQELLNAIEMDILKDHLEKSKRHPYERRLEYTIGTLLFNYNNPYYDDIVDQTFVGKDTDKENQKEFPFTSTKLNHEKLNDAFNWCSNSHREKIRMGLKFSTDRIDILNELKVN